MPLTLSACNRPVTESPCSASERVAAVSTLSMMLSLARLPRVEQAPEGLRPQFGRVASRHWYSAGAEMTNASIGTVCFVVATVCSGWCSAQTIVGPSGKPLHQAKCSQSPTGCYQQATRDCGGGPYQILDSESHAGGLFADILPGPVTWYTMSYACGRSDGRLGNFPSRGPRPPSMATCSRSGNTVSCLSN